MNSKSRFSLLIDSISIFREYVHWRCSLSKTKINLAVRNSFLWLWVYQLSGQLPCYVNQSGITTEFHCSVLGLVRSRLASWWSCASCLQQMSLLMSWIYFYITAHFFSSGAAFPSAFSISKMIRLKTSTAVCIERVLSAILLEMKSRLHKKGFIFKNRHLTLPRSPWLRTPWMQHPKNQQVSFPPLAW